MPPRRRPLRVKSAQYDFSGGVVGLISTEELGRMRYLRDALNVVFRPGRGFSVREGTRDIINATLNEAPTSIGKFYNAAGNKVFVATNSGSNLGKLWRVASSSFVQQTVAWGSMTSQKIRLVNANGVIIATQKGAVVPPMFVAQNSAAETWLTCTLPNPGFPAMAHGAAITGSNPPVPGGSSTISGAVSAGASSFVMAATATGTQVYAATVAGTVIPAGAFVSGSATVTRFTLTAGAGGNLTVSTTYYYRLRWRYNNGSSQATSALSVALSGAQNRVTVSNIPADTRTDYIGWTLERTKKNGDANGPFYLIADGTATSYIDDAADAGLGGIFERSVEALHGTPPNLDGLIEHKGRLFGWAGSTIYLSQPVFGGDEATGIFNWQADQIFTLDKDDGDTIQTAVIQSDRLVVFKRRSTHVIEGDDPDSFRVRRIADVGAAGYRAAAADGVHVYFISGDGIIFRMAGDRARPFGQFEAGLWLKELDLSRISDAVVVNHLGDAMLFAAAFEPATYNSHAIAYDLLTETWSRYDMRIIDAVVQKDENEFNRSTLLYVDPVAVVPASGTSAATNPSFVSWCEGAGDQESKVQQLNSSGVAQWTVQVSVSENLSQSPQFRPVMCNDGAGGVIVAFMDRASGGRKDVYAQRINAAGAIQWGAGGVVVADAGSDSTNREQLQIIADGAGGALIAWTDTRGAGSPPAAVYVHRITSAGAAFAGWGDDGTRIGDQLARSEANPRLLSDGSGGAFILVDELTGANSLDFQHISSAGALLAGSNGTNVAATASSGRMVADGTGGVIVCYGISGLSAKRLTSTGATTWGPTTVSVSGYAAHQPHAMVGDGAGGAVVFFVNTANNSVFVQAITNAGVLGGSDTVQSNASSGYGMTVGDQPLLYARAVRRTDGTYLFAYAYGPSDNPDRILVAHVNSAMSLLSNTTVRVTGLGGNVRNPTLVTDGADGCVIAWTDTRNDSIGDVYAQRISSTGTALWTANGVVVASGAAQQAGPFALFTDAPVGEQPQSRLAGYHVWSGFQGSTDFADASGLNGSPLHLIGESHFYDEGFPDDLKDYERVELHVEDLTTADFTLTIDFDETAPTATVPLSQVAVTDLWDDNAVDTWNDLATDLWIGSGRTELESGLAAGSVAKRHKRIIDAMLSEPVTVTGLVVDGRLLPDKAY